jgi:ferredoxin
MMINYRYYKNYSFFKTIFKYTRLIWATLFKPYQLKYLNHINKYKQHSYPYASVESNNEICQVCRICEEVCPTQSIKIEGEWQLNQSQCISCARCILVCPENYLK